MYKNVFDKELLQDKKYNGYMFWGACDYLAQAYTKKVSQQLASHEDVFKFYFEEYNYKEALNYLSSSSLFNPVNLLIIKTSKKIPKKEVDELLKVCSTNQDSYIIFECMGSDADFKSMAKSFTSKSKGVEVRFFEPYENEAVQILNEESQKLQMQIGFGQLAYLYSMHQKDLSLCVNDLQKLSILKEPITNTMINSQCFGMGSVSIDDFFLKLFTGQNINKDIFMMLEEGMNEIALINQTTGFIQQLFVINSYIKLNGQLDIKEIWGYPLPKDIANKRANLAMRFNLEEFAHMLEFFQELELALKTNSKLEVNSYTQSCFRNFSASLR